MVNEKTVGEVGEDLFGGGTAAAVSPEPEMVKGTAAHAWGRAAHFLALSREVAAKTERFRRAPWEIVPRGLAERSRFAFARTMDDVSAAFAEEYGRAYAEYQRWNGKALELERAECWREARGVRERFTSGAWVTDSEAPSLGEQFDESEAQYANLRSLNYASLRARGDAQREKERSIATAKRINELTEQRLAELRVKREGNERAATAAEGSIQ